MLRTIVHIDEEKCNGCGACAHACHEGAIAMVNGKARLIRDDYCDGMGDCLPACPADAITFEKREAAAYDEQAVAEHLARREALKTGGNPLSAPVAEQAKTSGILWGANASASAPAGPAAHHGCPGTQARTLRPQPSFVSSPNAGAPAQSAPAAPGVSLPGTQAGQPPAWQSARPGAAPTFGASAAPNATPTAAGPGVPGVYGPLSPAAQAASPSQLAQWPCQIKLVPVNAPYFQGADVLIAADCTAFACASLHRDLMAGRITLIGCPKLDMADYSQKLGAILAGNDIRSLTLARMEVPCCGGLAMAAQRAIQQSGKDIPLAIVTISCDGRILG